MKNVLRDIPREFVSLDSLAKPGEGVLPLVLQFQRELAELTKHNAAIYANRSPWSRK